MIKKNKLGVSIMIGYVLLITGAIVVGGIVYTWMKSYVPREAIECPDGVSLFIREAICEIEGSDYNLNLSISNNGRFGVDGYYIKSTNDTELEIATVDISPNLISGGNAESGIVLFSGGTLNPGENKLARYDIGFEPVIVEITPIRYEEIEGKNRLVSCGNAKIKEKITCS
jgi:hypothetical protein